MAMKKPGTPGSGVSVFISGPGWDTKCEFRRRYPLLTAHLEDGAWDNGDSRETSTLLLFVEEGQLKACINDRAVGRTAFVAADSVEAILERLETGLEDGGLDWRVKQGPRKRK